MDQVIQRILALGGSERSRRVWCSTEPLTFWVVKQAPHRSTGFAREQSLEIHSHGGLLFECNTLIPPRTGADEWKQDVVYCPKAPEACDDWIRLGAELGEIVFDFKGLDHEVYDFIAQVAHQAQLIPLSLAQHVMVVRIVRIRDRKALKEVLLKRYVPLVQKMGILEFSPQKQVAVVLEGRGFAFSMR